MHRHEVHLALIVSLALAGCDPSTAAPDAFVASDAGHSFDAGAILDTIPPHPDAYASDTGVDAVADDAYTPPPPDAYVPRLDGGPRPGGCDPAIADPAPGVQTARAKGATCAELGYYEYVPEAYATRSDWPLIIAFHGDGEVGNGTTDLPHLLAQGLPLAIQNDTWDHDHRFVVLSPQMADLVERRGDTVERFIAFAIANYDVDPTRIYLTGYSGGAEPLTNYLAYTSGGLVAAVAPISGYFAMPGTECSWREVPIWYFHGANDSGLTDPRTNSTQSYDTLTSCTPAPPVAPRYTLYANRAHDDWNLTYDLTGMDASMYPTVASAPGNTAYDISLYDWFLQYTR